ncbi:MAG: hypothetical protein AB8G15_17145 [Saprospiraceae bacterium]
MKPSFTYILFLCLLSACTSNESIFELSPAQSMIITGKGQGQDAALNPFSETKSIAMVKNIGRNSFMVRVQTKGQIIKELEIQSKEKKEINLEKGYELYLDSDLASKAVVKFKEGDED